MPWFASPIYPVVLIHADPVTSEPVRGEDGFCIRCKTGSVDFKCMYIFIVKGNKKNTNEADK